VSLLPGRLALALVSLLLVLLDQGTKAWVEAALPLGTRLDVLPVFAWVHVENTGAAFSMFADGSGWQRWFFVLLAFAFGGWLLRELSRLGDGDGWIAWAYACILGGAGGNLVDRIETGAVTDFVLVHWFDVAYFPAFNVADVAITIGATIWIGLAVLELLGRGPLVNTGEGAPD
jgi:signal peptidase II